MANRGTHIANGRPRLPGALLSLQAGISFITLLGMFLAPRPDAPVTLVPLKLVGEPSIPALLAASDVRLLARGNLPDSYVVTGPMPGFFDLIQNHGMLALNANAPGCGPSSLERRSQ